MVLADLQLYMKPTQHCKRCYPGKRGRLNILLTGEPQSGKTTLLNKMFDTVRTLCQQLLDLVLGDKARCAPSSSLRVCLLLSGLEVSRPVPAFACLSVSADQRSAYRDGGNGGGRPSANTCQRTLRTETLPCVAMQALLPLLP